MQKQKNDTTLRADVLDELKWDPSIREQEIAIAVKDGVITLGGFVDTYAQKLAAERAVKRVSGVKAISEQLEVKLSHGLERTDTELAHRILDAMRWDVEIPDERLKAKVENGWVTLEGAVDWNFQREAADRAIRYLGGVKGLSNLIGVKPQAKEKDVAKRIKDALRRHAEREADRIIVAATGGVVTLDGKVDTWTERAEVEQAAWSAPGVSRVEDRLMVGV